MEKKKKIKIEKRKIILYLGILLIMLSFIILILKLFSNYNAIAMTLTGITGFVLLIYSFFLEDIKKHRLAIILTISGIILVYILLVVFPLERNIFLQTTEKEINDRIDRDLDLVPIYIKGLEKSYLQIEENKELFRKRPTDLNYEEKEKVLELWSLYLNHILELEKLKEVHKHFYQINYLKYPDMNLRSFLIAYSSFIANHKHALLLQNLIGNNKEIETILNEKRDELSIPKNSYFRIKNGNTHPETLIQLNAGYTNLIFLKKTGRLNSKREKELINYSKQNYLNAYKIGGRTPQRFLENPSDYFQKNSFKAWFPFQVAGSKGISMTRTALRENFITESQIKDIKPELEPGDIMLQRRNWYLTNIGLPGFWPHSAIFIGNLSEMDNYFNNLTILKNKTASGYIKEKYPKVYTDLEEKDTDKNSKSVIESKRPGVIVKTLKDSAKADYLGVLRPIMTKEDKFKAIIESFKYYRRPYDFDFDFITDNEIVCSELVYKAYFPKEDKEGINFTLIEKAGRIVLPPNNIVKKFDEEYNQEGSELGFVLFLDGSEENQNASRKSIEEFRKSWKRPKWDIVQE